MATPSCGNNEADINSLDLEEENEDCFDDILKELKLKDGAEMVLNTSRDRRVKRDARALVTECNVKLSQMYLELSARQAQVTDDIGE